MILFLSVGDAVFPFVVTLKQRKGKALPKLSNRKKGEVLFDSPDLSLRLVLGESSRAFITFTVATGRIKTDQVKGDRKGFGEGIFDKYGYSMLYFVSKWDHWWQPDSVRECVAIAAAAIKANGLTDLTLYGSSMGAYGAAMYSSAIGASRCIMLAPQYSIDPRKPPYEGRWSKLRDLIEFRYDDMGREISSVARKYVLFDPLHPRDLAHAELFARHPNTTLLAVPFSGHSPAQVLMQGRLLKRCVLDMATDALDLAGFRQALRDVRRNSPLYWAQLGERAMKRRPELAELSIRRAIKLEPSNPSHLVRLLSLLIFHRQFAAAIDVGENGVRLFPRNFGIWRGLGVAALRQGDRKRSINALEVAGSLRPERMDVLRALETARAMVDSAAPVA